MILNRFFFLMAFLNILFPEGTGISQKIDILKSPPPAIFGTQLDNENYLPLAHECGMSWLRTNIYWSDIESKPGVYDWSKYDQRFEKFHKAGFHIIAILGGNPSWAAKKPYGPIDKPRIKDFQKFLMKAVERYDGDGIEDAPGSPIVNYWEFFNEPDLNTEEFGYAGPGWGLWGSNGSGYADLLREVYPVIKEANPLVQVVFGGIALENIGEDSKGNDIFDLKFLDTVLAFDGGRYFDIMNFHYYLPFYVIWKRFGKDISGKTNYIKKVMSSYGVEKPLICTEAGHWSGENSSLEFQADYVVKLNVRGIAGGIHCIIWYPFADSGETGNDPTRGLINFRGDRKPAFYAYKNLSSVLRNVSYERPIYFSSGKRGDIIINQDIKDIFKMNIFGQQRYEGYIFLQKENKKELFVLWSEEDDSNIKINKKKLKKIDKYGKFEIINGKSANPISLSIGKSPIFLEVIE